MYSTDVTDAQWNNIKNYLIGKERKRKISLRSVWNALVYVVETGCQWRMLPKDFPRWQVVYYYYRKWIDAELFDMILEKLCSKVRVNKGQKVMPKQPANKSFRPVHKRWIVDRTFACFDNDRRLCRNYELLMESSEEMVKLFAIRLLIKHF